MNTQDGDAERVAARIQDAVNAAAAAGDTFDAISTAEAIVAHTPTRQLRMLASAALASFLVTRFPPTNPWGSV